MSREAIVSHLETLLKRMNTPRLGKVLRDPVIPEEMPKTAFPCAYIETTDEEIEDITMRTNLRKGVMEVDVVVIIGGNKRDTQRNVLVEGIEKVLLKDRTVDNNAKDIALTRVESVAVGESAPYASVRMVFTVERHYTID